MVKVLKIFCLLLVLLVISTVRADSSYTTKVTLLTSKMSYYNLNMIVSEALYLNYKNKNHNYFHGLESLVTPQPFISTANLIYSICENDEEYVNTVLQIVHQFTYNATPYTYPIETIVSKIGDCDTFSYLVASLFLAKNMKTVLVAYDLADSNYRHMNVAVVLSEVTKVRTPSTFYFSYNSEKYYVAETTGGSSFNGWRAGELPSDLVGSNYTIMSLNNCEQSSIGEISSYFDEATETAGINVNIIPLISYFKIYGNIEPQLANQTVSIFVKYTLIPEETLLAEVKTNNNGVFEYTYIPIIDVEIASFRIGWSGNEDYRGAITQPTMLFIPFFIVLPFYIIIMLVVVLVLLYKVIKQRIFHKTSK